MELIKFKASISKKKETNKAYIISLLIFLLTLFSCKENETIQIPTPQDKNKSNFSIKLQKLDGSLSTSEFRLNHRFVLNYSTYVNVNLTKDEKAIFSTFRYKSDNIDFFISCSEAVEGAFATQKDLEKGFRDNYLGSEFKKIKLFKVKDSLSCYVILPKKVDGVYAIFGQKRTETHFIDFQIKSNSLNSQELSEVFFIVENAKIVNKKAPKTKINSLKQLLKEYSEITDFSDESIQNIKELTLIGELHTEDLTYLSELKSLEDLNIEQTEIVDISPLKNIISLKKVCLIRNEITDISPLQDLINLEVVSLAYTPLEDISPLSALKNLKDLWISHTKIKNIDALKKSYKLEELRMNNTQVTDLSPLRNIKKLRILGIEYTKIENYSLIGKLKGLVRLDLEGSSVTDISFVANLQNLMGISVNETGVKDIAVLYKLNSLKTVNLKNTKVNETTINSFWKSRPAIHIIY